MARKIIFHKDGPVSLVNLFAVRPQQQQGLLALQLEQTERFRVRMPGFLSSTFLRSLDGTRLLNYAQWERPEDVAAARASPAFQGHLSRLDEVDYANRMHLYKIAHIAAEAPPKLAVDPGVIADIDVIALAKAAQGTALEALTEQARQWLRPAPEGLLSIIVMASLDGQSMVSWCQWRRDQYPAAGGACNDRQGLLPIPDLGDHDRRVYEVAGSTVVAR